MQIFIPDQDFEASDNWTLGGLAQITGVLGAYTGSQAALLITQSPFDSGKSTVTTVADIELTAGRVYELRFWLQLQANAENSNYHLSVNFDHGQTPPTQILDVDPEEENVGRWVEKSVVFTAESATGELQFDTDDFDPAGVTVTRWLVDDVRLLDVATQQIFDAMISDFNDINGTGIFATTIAEVSENEDHWSGLETPGIMVTTAEGSTDPDTHARHGITDQRFNIKMRTRSATAWDDMRNFLDDVRNAIERTAASGGNVNGVSVVSIHTAVVENWSRINLNRELGDNVAEMEATILVRYTYDFGGL